jgi:hypothetical protein
MSGWLGWGVVMGRICLSCETGLWKIKLVNHHRILLGSSLLPVRRSCDGGRHLGWKPRYSLWIEIATHFSWIMGRRLQGRPLNHSSSSTHARHVTDISLATFTFGYHWLAQSHHHNRHLGHGFMPSHGFSSSVELYWSHLPGHVSLVRWIQ